MSRTFSLTYVTKIFLEILFNSTISLLCYPVTVTLLLGYPVTFLRRHLIILLPCYCYRGGCRIPDPSPWIPDPE